MMHVLQNYSKFTRRKKKKERKQVQHSCRSEQQCTRQLNTKFGVCAVGKHAKQLLNTLPCKANLEQARDHTARQINAHTLSEGECVLNGDKC